MFIDDILDQTRTMYTKFREFILPLNEKYAVTIKQDQKTNLYQIHTLGINNGNAGIPNSNLESTCKQIILGSKGAINEYYELKPLLISYSTDLIMDMLKQIIDKIEITGDNEPCREPIKKKIKSYLKMK